MDNGRVSTTNSAPARRKGGDEGDMDEGGRSGTGSDESERWEGQQKLDESTQRKTRGKGRVYSQGLRHAQKREKLKEIWSSVKRPAQKRRE